MRNKLDEKWQTMYCQIMAFMKKNKRRPSKHFVEDRTMSNWIKYNKKRYSRGLMDECHIKKFEKLLATAQSYYHTNQYDYISPSPRSSIKGTGIQLSIMLDGEDTHSGESND